MGLIRLLMMSLDPFLFELFVSILHLKRFLFSILFGSLIEFLILFRLTIFLRFVIFLSSEDSKF